MKHKPLSELDHQMMARALSLARRGEGRVEPNPMVGCVIARDCRILGEGFHRRFGGPHAEVEALRACTSSPRDATAYVSLEPCCHTGKTPPCTEALIQAGLKRVVVAVRDPNPLVSGGGIKRLRRAGIRVDTGVGAKEAIELLAPFATRVVLKRPYVIAKWAQSLDGKLATQTGASKWISGEDSRRIVHQLRARVDAILVGVGTVLADDPMLTARDVRAKRAARRVVLDTRLRIPLSSRVVATATSTPTTIFTSQSAARSTKANRLRRAGVDVRGCRTRGRRLSLSDGLTSLCDDGVTNLLVEGGPKVLSRFLSESLVDEAWVFTAPVLIGSRRAPGPFDESNVKTLGSAIKPRRVLQRRVGDDSFQRLWFTAPPLAG